MVQIKNPDGSPGCFVGKDVDISGAVITSTPDSKIIGSTKLTGQFFICSTQIMNSVLEAKTMAKIENTEITDLTISVDTADISGSKIDESAISVDTLEVKDSCFQFVAIDGVGKMVVKATESKIVGLNRLDPITIRFFKNADLTVADSTIKGVMAFYFKDGRAEISGSSIEGKRITDTVFPVARSNVFVEDSFLVFKDSTLCEAKHAQILAINTTSLRHSLKISQSKISSTVYCGGKIDNSEINSPIMSKLTVDIKDCLFEKDAVVKTKNAKVHFLNTTVEGNASILAPDCSCIKISNSTFSGDCVLQATEPCKIEASTIKENAKLIDVTSENTVFGGNSVCYGVFFNDCNISGSAHVGVDQNNNPIKIAKIVKLSKKTITSAKDFIFVPYGNSLYQISTNSPIMRWDTVGCWRVGKDSFLYEIGHVDIGQIYSELKNIDMVEILRNSQNYWAKKYDTLPKKLVDEVLMIHCWRMQQAISSTGAPEDVVSFYMKLSDGFFVDIKNKKTTNKGAILSCDLLDWLHKMEV